MRVETIPICADNYAYLVICEHTRQAAAVDPADAAAVLHRADELGVELSAIWNTHHHFDHSGGNEDLIGSLSARGRQLEVLGGRGSCIPGLTAEVGDGDELQVGHLAGRAIHTPGHTRDSIVIIVQGAAWTGDTLFGGGCGRLFEGDAATMARSLARLAALPESTRVYPGHEYTRKNLGFARSLEQHNQALADRIDAVAALRSRGRPSVPSTIGEELATNPFLRCGSEEIQRSIGLQGGDLVAVFSEVRRRRDTW